MPLFRAETPQDAGAIEDLHETLFGPGRHQRSVARLRHPAARMEALCLVAKAGVALAGSIRGYALWAGETPACLISPVAVSPLHQGEGIGRALVTRFLRAAKAEGLPLVLLKSVSPAHSENFYRPLGFVPTVDTGLVWEARDPAQQAGEAALVMAFELEAGALARAAGPLQPRLPSLPPSFRALTAALQPA